LKITKKKKSSDENKDGSRVIDDLSAKKNQPII